MHSMHSLLNGYIAVCIIFNPVNCKQIAASRELLLIYYFKLATILQYHQLGLHLLPLNVHAKDSN